MIKNVMKNEILKRLQILAVMAVIIAVLFPAGNVSAAPVTGAARQAQTGKEVTQVINKTAGTGTGTGVTPVDQSVGRMNGLLKGIVRAIGIVVGIFSIVFFFFNQASHNPEGRNTAAVLLVCAVGVFFSPEIIGFIFGITI